MLALGSRGDVQPLAVLAGALGRRGVPVTFVALAEYDSVVRAEAPEARFVPVAGRLGDAVRRGKAGEFLTRSPGGQWLLLHRWTAGMASAVVDAVLAAVSPGAVVVTGVLTHGVAHALTVASGNRAATVVFTGLVPTLERDSHLYSTWFSGWRPYDAWGVRLAWHLAIAAGRAVTREARSRLGLPRSGFAEGSAGCARHPVIVAASPTLVPPASDWPAGVHQTGYLAPGQRASSPDAALAAFLEGKPTVYVGFGSFTHFSTPADLDLVASAARSSGHRVVTPAPPFTRPGRVDRSVYAVGPVPHDWLFARVAGTIHHGGSGTTHAALRAGVPSAVVPFGVDQPYHARRLHALGVGPEPLPLKRLTATSLAALIGAVASPTASGYRRRAAEVGELVRAEDGVTRTVELLERLGYLA